MGVTSANLTPQTDTRNLQSVTEAGARQWLLDNPNVISANIHDAFSDLVKQNPALARLSDADIRAAAENYNQFLQQKLSDSMSIKDSLGAAGADTLGKNPALAQAVNNNQHFLDLELMESLRRNNGIGATEQADHYTYDRDFYAEQQAQYVQDMANYIATYTSHKEMSGADLKDMLDGYGVPAEYHEKIAQTLEDKHNYKIAIEAPEPEAQPQVAVTPQPEPEPAAQPAVYRPQTNTTPGMGWA